MNNDDNMNKWEHIKIKSVYEEIESMKKDNDYHKYTILLSNNKIYEMDNFDKTDFYIGTIGKEIGSIKCLKDRGKKIPNNKLPKIIKDWIDKFNKFVDEQNNK